MIERLLVVQLTESDMAQLLMLIEIEAGISPRGGSNWKRILDKMREQINQQLAGDFFQCAACLEGKLPEVS